MDPIEIGAASGEDLRKPPRSSGRPRMYWRAKRSRTANRRKPRMGGETSSPGFFAFGPTLIEAAVSGMSDADQR
jgi:hypothetical protein